MYHHSGKATKTNTSFRRQNRKAIKNGRYIITCTCTNPIQLHSLPCYRESNSDVSMVIFGGEGWGGGPWGRRVLYLGMLLLPNNGQTRQFSCRFNPLKMFSPLFDTHWSSTIRLLKWNKKTPCVMYTMFTLIEVQYLTDVQAPTAAKTPHQMQIHAENAW